MTSINIRYRLRPRIFPLHFLYGYYLGAGKLLIGEWMDGRALGTGWWWWGWGGGCGGSGGVVVEWEVKKYD